MKRMETGILLDACCNPWRQPVADCLAQERKRVPGLATSREKAGQIISGLGSLRLVRSKDTRFNVQNLPKQLLGLLASAQVPLKISHVDHRAYGSQVFWAKDP